MCRYLQTNFVVFLIIICLQSCFGLRRIMQGGVTPNERRFMVYLVKSQDATVEYDAWLCGGVIVHPSFIITSAACVEDVQFMYAIAGYSKYRDSKEIYMDPCTRNKKKKIVMICVPKLYDLQYEEITKWANLDIGVGQVESPYDFFDKTYLEYGCSYPPSQIDINYESKYAIPGTDAFVLGWGHTGKYRDEDDTTDYNQRDLRDAPVKIVKKSYCKDKMQADFSTVIDRYMICSYGAGRLNSEGRVLRSKVQLKSMCQCVSYDCSNCGIDDDSIRLIDGKSPGFCQNDHGGPLVGWAGGNLVLLGVQSVFMIDPQRNCVGPFMYTGTHCVSKFIDCVISKGKYLANNCDNTTLGFNTLRRTISWKEHPDGPALNEKN